MTKEEFFEDYESLDKESQRILLGAWGNTIPFGNTAAMQQKGFYHSKTEYNTAKNTNFFLGETIRGMHNVSPILQLPPSPNTVSSQFIKDTYFIDAQKKGDTNKEILIKEIIYNTRNGYTFIQDEVFEDTNKNGIFGDLGDAMDFKLLTFLSDDGNKVSEAHKAVEAKTDEILLFIEKNEDLLSQRRLYAKIGKNIRSRFFDSNGKLSETLLQEILSARDNEADILKELLEKGTIEAKTISLENFLSKFKRMFKTTYLAYFVLGKISKEIANGLDFLKIPENVWDPDHKEYVFDKENLLKNLTINGDKINKLENLFLGSNIKFNKAATVVLELLRPKLQPIAKRWIDAYNQNITETIESIFALEENNIVDAYTDIAAMRLAFQCGIWNGFIDFLSSFFHFANIVFSAGTSMIENPAQMLETLDNIIDFLLDPEAWKNFLNESYNFIIEMMSSLKKLFGEENINWCKVAYFVGFGVAFVATFFIPFVDVVAILGKLGKVGEFINTFAKVFSEMYSDLVQGIKKLSAEAIKYGNKAISDIIAFFRSESKLRKFFEKIKNEIIDWFVKNKKYISILEELLGLGLGKETIAKLKGLGLELKIGKGIVVNGISNGKYIEIYHKGVKIFEGLPSHAADFSKKLEKMSKEAAEKYLDDLLNKLNKFLPENCDIIFKDGAYNFKDLSTDELVGLVEVNSENFLEFAIYRKGLKTKVSGQEVFNSLIEHLKIRKIPFKGIKGIWSGASDNVTKFNEAIENGLSAEKAAFKTWTGERASEHGFDKVLIEKLEPHIPPYTKIYVKFYK